MKRAAVLLALLILANSAYAEEACTSRDIFAVEDATCLTHENVRRIVSDAEFSAATAQAWEEYAKESDAAAVFYIARSMHYFARHAIRQHDESREEEKG